MTFRLGFRFYTPRLQVGSCSSVSATFNGGSNTNYWCQQGSCSATCRSDGRRFYANFHMYRNAVSQSQWPYWSSGQYYDFTFTFSSVTEDTDSLTFANHIFITGALVWENSRYHINDNSKCGCWSMVHWPCVDYGSGYRYCCWRSTYCQENGNRQSQCTSDGQCNRYCNQYHSCRWHYDWGYRAALSNEGYDAPTTHVAQSVRASFNSRMYSQ